MGCDFLVNIGPVIVVKNPPVNRTEPKKCCCNDSCQKFHQTSFSRFCEDCGTEITIWNEPIVAPKYVDFYELFKDTIIPANHERQREAEIILIANQRINPKLGFHHFNLKYEPFKVFPKIDEINGYIENFKQTFMVELAKLKEIFGETNVSVVYGTIGDISC